MNAFELKFVVLVLQAQGHLLMSIDDAYRSRIAELQALVNGELTTKRNKLVQQVSTWVDMKHASSIVDA